MGAQPHRPPLVSRLSHVMPYPQSGRQSKRQTHFLLSPAGFPALWPLRACGLFSDALCESRGAVNLTRLSPALSSRPSKEEGNLWCKNTPCVDRACPARLRHFSDADGVVSHPLLRGCAGGLLGVWTVKRTIRVTLMRYSVRQRWLSVNYILIYFQLSFEATERQPEDIGRRCVTPRNKKFYF
jgi:hypothetical protein